MNSFEKSYGPIDQEAVFRYQGQFADLNTVKGWDDKDIVVYGNHLFDHWNATALSNEEFENNYRKNEIALSQLKNSANLFSFTNGRFSNREVMLLKKLGAERIFSSSGCININPSQYLLDRISLGGKDYNENSIWFKIGLGFISNKRK